jgi:oxygen-independent coproporphyrinogen-3 oxidase
VTNALRESGCFTRSCSEITVETNPESASIEKLELLRKAGVDRISIGAQSFDPRYLEAFDRAHSADQIAMAVANARAVGFGRLNLDLIFAKPDEDLDHWLRDLDAALSLHPDHLSCYELAYEAGTTFYQERLRGKLEELPEETRLRFYHDTIHRLSQRGFDSYETSAFAKTGQMCLHNLVYWTSGNWVGVGAGAATSMGNVKFTNLRHPADYVRSIRERGTAVDEATRDASDVATRFAEIMMMGMRLSQGLPLDTLARRAACGPESVQFLAIDSLVTDGLLVVDDGWVRPTERGRDLGNVVARRFLDLR